MDLCLRACVVLVALAAEAVAADQYQPGPAPTIGPLKHLTEAEATSNAPRDRLEFGIGERVTFWIDRETWNDVDLMRPSEDARWRDVPDEIGIAIWAIDRAGDVYPTIGDQTTMTCSMSPDADRIMAKVTDSGLRGKDEKTAVPALLAGGPGRIEVARRSVSSVSQQAVSPFSPRSRGTLFGTMNLGLLCCLLEAEAAPAEKQLAATLYEFERRVKRARETRIDDVERDGRELLARFDDPESQGLIYHTMAKIAAQSGQIAPRVSIEFSEAALKHPLPQDLRIRARVYWGDALQVLDYGEFPKRRPEAADVYLKALADVLEFKPLPFKNEPPGKRVVSSETSGDGDDKDDPGGKKAFDAHMANWEAGKLNDTMQRNRKVVIGQLVSLYNRNPPAPGELEARAKAAIADPEVVRQLMDELAKARARKDPAGAAKGNP